MSDKTTTKNSFKSEIWKKLSSIDVSNRTKEKNKMTYLSWAWSWGTLMENYPDSEYLILPEIYLNDGSCQVEIKVTIRDKDRHASRTMRLAVMDYKNQAVINPDAVSLNKAHMRCLTKCLALFGLAHYIYANEDMPEASKVKSKPEYEQSRFDEKYPMWVDIIKQGKKSAESIITMMQEGFNMSDYQLSQLNELMKIKPIEAEAE